jgi:quercetin dioxygenase-like cupin family protein
MRTWLPHLAPFALALAVAVPASAQSPKPAAKSAAAPASAVTLTVQVTSSSGQAIGDAKVTVTGPVTRQGATDPGGIVRLSGMRPGTYRAHFEHPKFVTFEREVILLPGKSMAVDVTLTEAPPPPAPPPPAPVAPAPQGTPGEPKTMSLPDFIERNLITREPVKESPLGCSGVLNSVLIQIKEPLAERVHDGADETLYVVAGQGTIKLGGRESGLDAATLVVIPRGTPYSVTRRGSKPLIILATQSGEPCGAAHQ